MTGWDQKRILKTAGALFGWLLVFGLLYTRTPAGPAYQNMILTTSNKILKATNANITIRQDVAPEVLKNATELKFYAWKFNYYTNAKRTQGVAFKLTEASARLLYVSLALMPPLFLLTPTRWSRRLLLLALGLIVLTILNVMMVVLYASLTGYFRTYTSNSIPDLKRMRVLWNLFRIFFGYHPELFSVGLWGLFCLGYHLRKPVAQTGDSPDAAQ